ncbi:hypothetical protein FRX31_004829 [Thalictrum thalictroides]|uniref:Uncharacterized protein n=1 Tax=Thalictrum thalictroides TaxID=46969 RepID=A0A7J6X9W2_THATH|nr:hypothetical protein FRX31_004829 [Thalictrum thalictroides]
MTLVRRKACLLAYLSASINTDDPRKLLIGYQLDPNIRPSEMNPRAPQIYILECMLWTEVNMVTIRRKKTHLSERAF